MHEPGEWQESEKNNACNRNLLFEDFSTEAILDSHTNSLSATVPPMATMAGEGCAWSCATPPVSPGLTEGGQGQFKKGCDHKAETNNIFAKLLRCCEVYNSQHPVNFGPRSSNPRYRPKVASAPCVDEGVNDETTHVTDCNAYRQHETTIRTNRLILKTCSAA